MKSVKEILKEMYGEGTKEEIENEMERRKSLSSKKL